MKKAFPGMPFLFVARLNYLIYVPIFWSGHALVFVWSRTGHGLV
jgi:hypothetical protein